MIHFFKNLLSAPATVAMEPDIIYKKDENMVWRQIGEGIVLVLVHREVGELDSVYTLNETADFIWSQIDGNLSVADIWKRLVAEYEVEPDRAEEDVRRYLDQLLAIAAVRKAA